MQIDPVRAKVWSRVRDNASFHSGMVLVAYAETWATRMEKKIARGRQITPALILETADSDLSGYQIGSAYQILRLYWLHREHLLWDSFMHVPVRGSHKEPAKKRREQYSRTHPARTFH